MFFNGELDTGKILLRDYVNATVGFEALGAQLDESPKSLMRILSGQGNPRGSNLFALNAHLKHREGVDVRVDRKAEPA